MLAAACPWPIIEQVDVSTAGVAANATVHEHSVSADGTYVLFETDASNLDGIEACGVFLRNRAAGTTSRLLTAAPHDSGNGASPVMTPDARFVVFRTPSALVPADTNGKLDAYMLDRSTGVVERVSVDPSGA